MAEIVSINIQGEAELSRMLARAERAVSDKAIKLGLGAGALVVMNDAKDRAPFKTGTLMRSISQAPVPGHLSVTVGTDLPYAARMEYGFVGRDSLGRRYNQPAQPYLRPALRENSEEVRDIVIQVIKTKLLAAMA